MSTRSSRPSTVEEIVLRFRQRVEAATEEAVRSILDLHLPDAEVSAQLAALTVVRPIRTMPASPGRGQSAD
jgi:hypothetical protein